MGLGTKLLLGAAAIFGLDRAYQWWETSHALKSFASGHSYAVTWDYTKDPVSPMTQAGLQAILDAKHPGVFNVAACAMVPNAKQVAATIIVSGPSTYASGADFLAGWPAGFGKVTLDAKSPPKDMGAPGTTPQGGIASAASAILGG